MRKIKFYVILWDGADPKTIEHFTFEDDVHEDFVVFDGGEIRPADDSLIIREYTGLKDKNGKEIYEGDILAKYMFISWVVVWDKSGFYVYNLWDNAQEYHYVLDDVHDREVIGNLYENPELLKGGK